MDGNLAVEKREEGFDLSYQDIPFVTGLRPDPTLGNFNLDNLSKNKTEGEFGDCIEYKSIYKLLGKDALQLRLKKFQETVIAEFQFLIDIENPEQDDSFYDTSFHLPMFEPLETKWLTFTWGLRDGTEGHGGGTWPTAIYGNSPTDLPRQEAYAPLLLRKKGHATAISPLNHFLVSPMSTSVNQNELNVSRGLHGSVPWVEKGQVLKTIFVFDEGLNKVLESWGQKLLYQGNKNPDKENGIMLNRLGHWNAYGGYYSELFDGYDQEALLDLSDYFDEEDLPIDYFGVDLWYGHEEIGKAKDYLPNKEKYPEGLGSIREKTGRPYVMHLSALDPEGEFPANEQTGQPEYGEIYREIASTIKTEGGVCAWHDWLRSEQSSQKSLRSDLHKSHKWFKQMAKAFSEKDIEVMLCMETIGMLLESTQYKNIKYCRNSTDYLFKQKGQIGKLWADGKRGFGYESPESFIEQQILVGSLIDSLGLYPFHDLFISNGSHPEDFEEENPQREALLSTLSSGPVGLGDKVDEIDHSIVNKLTFPDGHLARPDKAYRPLEETIGERTLVFFAQSQISDHTWKYLTVANISDWPVSYGLELNEYSDEVLYNFFSKSFRFGLKGNLKPAQVDYYIIAPKLGGFRLIGFLDKYITAPSTKIKKIDSLQNRVEIRMNLTPFENYRFGVASDYENFNLECLGGVIIKQEGLEKLQVITFEPTEKELILKVKSKK